MVANEIIAASAENLPNDGIISNIFTIKNRTNEKLKIFSLLESELNYNQFIDLEWMIASGLYSQPVIDSITIILDALKSKAIQKDKSFLETIDR